MSQHTFNTTLHAEEISIVLGWDRPLQCYFMVIERLTSVQFPSTDVAPDDAGEGDACILYSNLHEDDPFNLSLDYFRLKLAELGIPVPESMFIQVEIDRALGVGNRTVSYNGNGTFADGPP